jgi:TRAP-type C4-dicarboxylate transport system substrate-binding protein
LRKPILKLILILFVISFFNLDSIAQEKPKFVIKLATLVPKMSAESMEEFKELVKQKTNNEVSFKVYYGGVQGDEDDMLRKVKVRQLDGAALSGHGLGMIVPEVRVTELPYLFWNYEEVEYVRSKLENDMNRLFEEKGFVVMGWGEAGFVYSFSKVPITSVEIARKQKWWLWDEDPVAKAFYDSLGISPVSLSITDVLTSLSTKLIDTAGITPYGAVILRWYKRFDYMNEYPVMNLIGAIIIRKDVWDEISPESQYLIKKMSKNHFKDISTNQRKADAKSIEVLKKVGVSVVRADLKSQEAQFVLEASKKTRESLVGKLYSQELLDRTISFLNEYRANHPESAIMHIE